MYDIQSLTTRQDVIDFGDGSFSIVRSHNEEERLPRPAIKTPTWRLAVIAIAVLVVIATAGGAHAQYARDATQGFYGGLGAYGGAICCGPGGAVIGGAGGAAVGGWVHDTIRHPPQYELVYPAQSGGTKGPHRCICGGDRVCPSAGTQRVGGRRATAASIIAASAIQKAPELP